MRKQEDDEKSVLKVGWKGRNSPFFVWTRLLKINLGVGP